MYKKYIKQIIDTVVAVLLFVILLPLIFLVFLITLIDLGLPVHNVIREREGKNKKTFIMYKFRTKVLGKEYVKDGSCYTKVSKVIDKFRLNELPQLINVIKGDMALVGPRPFIPNDKLPKGEISHKRYLVKPGLTGLAQINGGRLLTHEEKLKYDEIYYDNLSFKTDLMIILKTPFALLKQSKIKK